MNETIELDKAMILVGGKVQYGDRSFPKERYKIDDQRMLDESQGEQLEHIYGYLNSVFTVLNQHACILNGHSTQFVELTPVEEVHSSLGMLGKTELDRTRNTQAEQPENGSGDLPKYLDPLSTRLLSIEASMEGFGRSFQSFAEGLESLEETMNKRLMSCALIDEVRREKRENDLRIAHDLHKEIDLVTRRMDQFESQIMEREKSTDQKISDISKQTVWKIEDCNQLLKLRPTEEVVLSLNKELEARIDEIINFRNTSPIKERHFSILNGSNQETKDDFTNMVSRILHLENKYARCKQSGRAGFFEEKYFWVGLKFSH